MGFLSFLSNPMSLLGGGGGGGGSGDSSFNGGFNKTATNFTNTGAYQSPTNTNSNNLDNSINTDARVFDSRSWTTTNNETNDSSFWQALGAGAISSNGGAVTVTTNNTDGGAISGALGLAGNAQAGALDFGRALAALFGSNTTAPSGIG